MSNPTFTGEDREGTPRPLFRLNDQSPENATNRIITLDVHSVFPTIQGEGPFAGEAAAFVRLAGCNLQCRGCDTDYTTGRRDVPVRNLVAEVMAILPATRLVVITGGEPFRQDISSFVKLLADNNCRIQIETNGTIYRQGFPFELVTIVCSPKIPHMEPKLCNRVNYWKYVIEEDIEGNGVDSKDGLPTHLLGRKLRPMRPLAINPASIYVQPFDSRGIESNQRNLAAAIRSARTFGYKLCIQIHKVIGLE